MIRMMIDLSTAHMPGATPNFGDLRTIEHIYGWVVFVSPRDPGKGNVVPEWLEPILSLACDAGCVLINFDADAEEHRRFETFEWSSMDTSGYPLKVAR